MKKITREQYGDLIQKLKVCGMVESELLGSQHDAVIMALATAARESYGGEYQFGLQGLNSATTLACGYPMMLACSNETEKQELACLSPLHELWKLVNSTSYLKGGFGIVAQPLFLMMATLDAWRSGVEVSEFDSDDYRNHLSDTLVGALTKISNDAGINPTNRETVAMSTAVNRATFSMLEHVIPLLEE